MRVFSKRVSENKRGQGVKDSRGQVKCSNTTREKTLDYLRSLYISYGSNCELETQIEKSGAREA